MTAVAGIALMVTVVASVVGAVFFARVIRPLLRSSWTGSLEARGAAVDPRLQLRVDRQDVKWLVMSLVILAVSVLVAVVALAIR